MTMYVPLLNGVFSSSWNICVYDKHPVVRKISRQGNINEGIAEETENFLIVQNGWVKPKH